MTERLRSASTAGHQCPKMENDLSPRKTLLVLVIVVGCFAVLWPKVFYPMLVGSANQHIKPSPIDKTSGCCDVISETDVNTIKIMSELCGTIIKATEEKPLSGKEIVRRCRQEVLETCGIDISVVLQEQVRLGQSVKQILDEIRSLNGSLCLKYNYGLAPWRLGVPHRITVKAADAPNIRQERPMHLRSELVHPAFRERGRAIPQPQAASPSRPPPRVVEGRPGPIPGMRPTLGGAGHVVPPSKQGTSSMSVIMPIYTIGIVIFFTYTLMKIIFKKQPETVGDSLYPPVDPDPHFRKEVFESESSRIGARLNRDNISSKLVVNAMSALLDEVDQEIEARRKSSEVASQDLVNGTLSNGDAVKPHDEEQPTVKVLGMEMTASCEGGKKWSRPESPVLPTSPPPPPAEPVPPPQEIYLEGALPAQSQLLVSESAIEPEPRTGEDPAVVLSGKMTLSVISLDSENGEEEVTKDTTENAQEPIQEEIITKIENEVEQTLAKLEDSVQKNIQDLIAQAAEELPDEEPARVEEIAPKKEDLLLLGTEIVEKEELPVNVEEVVEVEEEIDKPPQFNQGSSGLEKDIEAFLQKMQQNDFQAPSITLESEDVPQTLEVESLEREVDDLIKEALDSIQQKQEDSETSLDQRTNEIRQNEPVQTLQVLGFLDKEREKSSELELKPDISNEIEKLIQEVKNLPLVQEKSDITAQQKSETEKIDQNNEAEEITSIQSRSSKDAPQSTANNLSPEEKITAVVDSKSNIDSCQKVKDTEGTQDVEEKVEKSTVESVAATKATNEVNNKSEDVKKSNEAESDEELGTDEELVEEIEEIVYEEESGEEEEIEVEEVEEESEEEIPNDRNTNRTDSSSVQRVNGERSSNVESKYTTVSGATAAENDISDEELTDNEEVEEEEEIIEVEEEVEDEDDVNEEGNNVNHLSGESEPEL